MSPHNLIRFSLFIGVTSITVLKLLGNLDTGYVLIRVYIEIKLKFAFKIVGETYSYYEDYGIF